MAKVKCLYCKQYFDREKEPYEQIGNRYLHKNCLKLYDASLSQEERELLELKNYIKQVFHQDKLSTKINQQIKAFTTYPYNYNYKGILEALRYWYEVKKGDVAKANGGIGIVPSIYEDARRYYFYIFAANSKNYGVQVIQSQTEEVHIVPPERHEKKRPLFNFLDEEGD